MNLRAKKAWYPSKNSASFQSIKCTITSIIPSTCSKPPQHAPTQHHDPKPLQVTRVEFLMFILQHLDIVDRGEMEQILTLFESCDANGDGVLDLQDVKAAVSRPARQAASQAANRARVRRLPSSSNAAATASAVASTQQDNDSAV
jgi:hypothetical protein